MQRNADAAPTSARPQREHQDQARPGLDYFPYTRELYGQAGDKILQLHETFENVVRRHRLELSANI